MLTFVVAVTVALVVSFMCSLFESVLLSAGHAHIEGLALQGKRSGELLRTFKRRIDVPIAAILTVNTMAHTMGAAVAGASYTSVFDPQTLWIFTIVFTIAVLLFTEIVPKTLGVTYSAVLATPVAYGIWVLTIVLRPVVVVSERLSRSLRGGAQAPVTSVEEIRLLALLGQSEGIVGPRTADIIVRATRLRQLRVADVLLPRARVIFLSGDATREQIVERVQSSGHSRYPYSPSDDFEDISGIVLAKDLLFHAMDRPNGEIDWAALVREPLIVPLSMPLNRLLRAFQELHVHMALVVDEYGGFEGIVTLEDVLEEIVGEIEDEGDEPVQDISVNADGSLEVRGTTELRRVCARLGKQHPEALGVVSVSGLLSRRLGRVPAAGDAVTWNGCTWEVLQASRQRAESVRVRRLEDHPPAF